MPLNLMKVYKNYNKENDEWYFLKIDVQYLERHNDLPFLSDRIKI